MSTPKGKIAGGYILKARKALESELMDKPPLYSKLWDWMLLRAEWRAGKKLRRGQFHTTIEEMREAMAWKVGYRKITPSIKEIRSAYEWFAGKGEEYQHSACEGHNEGHSRGPMIGTTKGTRGMVITILNYTFYQDPKNYEGHSEGHTEEPTKGTTKGELGAQDREEVEEENKEESPLYPPGGKTPPAPPLVNPPAKEKATKKPKAPTAKVVVCPEYIPPAWKPVFQDWLNYKRERKQPYTETGAKACFKELVELSGNDPEVGRRIVQQSMASNYQGLFALKNLPATTGGNGTGGPPGPPLPRTYRECQDAESRAESARLQRLKEQVYGTPNGEKGCGGPGDDASEQHALSG